MPPQFDPAGVHFTSAPPLQASSICALVVAGSEGSQSSAAAPAGGVNWLSFLQAVVAGTLANMMYKRFMKDPAALEAPVVCAASLGVAGLFLVRAFSPLAGKAKQ